MRFTSGISNDKTEFLMNMNWYNNNDAKSCFELSKMYHGLSNDYYIKADEYLECYMSFRWEGNTYYPSESDELNGELIRKYVIYSN